jgi:hypothetical protein
LAGQPPGAREKKRFAASMKLFALIVQEFVEDGKPLPEGPEDSVEVKEVSQQEPRIAVTV